MCDGRVDGPLFSVSVLWVGKEGGGRRVRVGGLNLQVQVKRAMPAAKGSCVPPGYKQLICLTDDAFLTPGTQTLKDFSGTRSQTRSFFRR